MALSELRSPDGIFASGLKVVRISRAVRIRVIGVWRIRAVRIRVIRVWRIRVWGIRASKKLLGLGGLGSGGLGSLRSC